MKQRRLPLVLLCLVVLQGCSGMKAQDFAGTEPRFVLEEYFQGRSKAWGIFQDRGGNLKRQFAVDLEGRWDGEVMTLEEDFRYADGEVERRVWSIRKVGEHAYEGRADDVVGVARGEAYGRALNWSYDLMVPVGNDTWKLRFDDWMFLQEDGVLINVAKVSKFGFHVGTVTIFFRRLDEDVAQTQEFVAAAAVGSGRR